MAFEAVFGTFFVEKDPNSRRAHGLAHHSNLPASSSFAIQLQASSQPAALNEYFV